MANEYNTTLSHHGLGNDGVITLIVVQCSFSGIVLIMCVVMILKRKNVYNNDKIMDSLTVLGLIIINVMSALHGYYLSQKDNDNIISQFPISLYYVGFELSLGYIFINY